ncbi:MAG: hypothetical protein IJ071_08750 [Ruminococcus sp.]|nr:hypothetical protein [Ruminococcus sp.]
MNRSNFPIDKHGEAVVSQFLKENYFDWLVSSGQIRSFRFCDDFQSQRSGTDLVITNNDGSEFAVDLKAALTYINRPSMDTFAFEVDYKNRGVLKTGWLLDSCVITDVLALCWLKGKYLQDSLGRTVTTGYSYIRAMEKDDLTEATVISIRKLDLLSALLDAGLTPDVMRAHSAFMRENGLKEMRISPDMKLYLSGHLAEEPCNVVVSRRKLLEICQSAYTVTRNGTKPLIPEKGGKENDHR